MFGFVMRFALLCMLLLGTSHVTLSAPLRDEGRRLLDKKKAQQLKERTLQPNSRMQVPTTAVPQTAEEKRCFQVEKITVGGVKSLKTSQIKAITKPYTHKCLGSKGVEAITQLITNLYIEEGYITTRTYIPEQDITTGILKLTVIEGFIEKITYFEQHDTGEKIEGKKGNKKTKKKAGPSSMITTSFPTKAGDLLILKHIEQGVDQISRVPSSTAKLNIKPGEKPGGSIVEVTNTIKDLWRGKVSYSQDRYDQYVSERMNLTLDTDNLLNLNDSWSLTYSGSASSNALNYSVSMPYGYYNFSTYGSYSEQLNQLTPTAEQYSQTAALSANVEYLGHRSKTSKGKLSASLSHKWSNRYINATELTPHQLTIMRLGGSYEKYLPKGTLSFNPGISIGTPFGASKSNSEEGSPQSTFIKLDSSASYYTMLDDSLTLYSSAYLQYSPQVLYSSEQGSLGGSGSVHGFSQVATAGEVSFYVQNEFSAPLSYFVKKLKIPFPKGVIASHILNSVKPYAYLDAGLLSDHANQQKYWMVGGSLGLRYNTERLGVNLSISSPLLYGWHTTKPSSSIDASLSINLKLF